MNQDIFASKAELADIKIKLCHIGLSLYDSLMTREEIVKELEKTIMIFEEFECNLYRKPL